MLHKNIFAIIFTVIIAILSGCNEATKTTQPGSEFVGKWEIINNPKHLIQKKDEMSIYHNNGNNFIIENRGKKIPATFKDGQLQISGGFITYVIDNATGNLVGKGDEYRKVGN